MMVVFSVFWSWMNGLGLVYNSIESVVLVGGVVYSSDGAVWFHQTVLSLDDVAISGLMLVFNVSGVEVLNSVFESVFRVGLKKKYKCY